MELRNNKCSVNGMGLSLSLNFLFCNSLQYFSNSENLFLTFTIPFFRIMFKWVLISIDLMSQMIYPYIL